MQALEAELCRTKDKLTQLQDQDTHREAEIRQLAAEWEASLENNDEHREVNSEQSSEQSHASVSNVAERQVSEFVDCPNTEIYSQACFYTSQDCQPIRWPPSVKCHLSVHITMCSYH